MAQGGLGSLWGAILGAFGAGPASGTIEAITGTALETLLGPSLQEAKQYAEAYIETPKNHDLERSLRFAALLACLHLILEQNRPEEAEAAMERGKPRDTFCGAARKWVHGQLFALGEVQNGAHRESVATYQVSLNTALASQPDLRDAARAAQARKTAEKSMWRELVDAVPDQQFPTDFEDRFLGTNGDGWFGYFIIFLREALKNQDNARHAFFIGGLSDLQNAVARIDEAQARLEEGLKRFEEGQTQLLQGQGEIQSQLSALTGAIAREKGVPIAPLRAVLALLGEKDIAQEEIPARLEAGATRLLELERTLAQPIQGDAAAQAARDEARRLIAQGDFDAAAARLRQGREEARKRRQDSQRIEATMAADEAGLAELALRYREAAARYGDAAALVHFDAKASWAYLLDQADALNLQGDKFGDNAALTESVEVFKRALSLSDRDQNPLLWAGTHNNLGTALQALGEREACPARLEEAVIAYRAALEELTRDRLPQAWAMTQNNLGNALRLLGAQDLGTMRLEEAVTAYRAGLEEITRDHMPLEWAATQNNLGNALSDLGEKSSNTALLQDAIKAYRAALKEYTRDHMPLDWAMTQNNLGATLLALGNSEDDTTSLAKAITAFRAALREWTRDRLPLKWAITQQNLGTALSSLGQRRDDKARLAKAVIAYRAALEENTRDRVPLAWASSQHGLAITLARLAERSVTREPLLAEAITHMQEAIDGYGQVGDIVQGSLAALALAELKAKAQ